MTDTHDDLTLPERIWAHHPTTFDEMDIWQTQPHDHAKEYVRADLAAARIAELEAERDEARAGNHAANEHEPTWAQLCDYWRERAIKSEAATAPTTPTGE